MAQHLAGDAAWLGAAERREIDVGVSGRAEPVEDGVGEQRTELVRPGAHAEPGRGGVDVVEVAGVDRADEGQRGVGERVEVGMGWISCGRPAGFVSRGQRHDAQTGPLARVGRDVGEEGGAGQQLERRVQHERVAVADDFVARHSDDGGGGVDQPLVVEPDEVTPLVLVGDLVDADALQRVRRGRSEDVGVEELGHRASLAVGARRRYR